MTRTFVVGIMGPGEKATAEEIARAETLGALIAKNGWDTLSGGRPVGVMESVLKGAKQAGGRTIGIITTKPKKDASAYADIVIATGMGSGRNIINVLSSDAVVACGGQAGTASEIALALKEKKPVFILTEQPEFRNFFRSLAPDLVTICDKPEDVIEGIRKVFHASEAR